MRLHVVIRGRVQGVGFRWFVRETARRLNLAGWVKNRPDGSVEVDAEGDADLIERLRAALAIGPDGAEVVAIDDAASTEGSLARPFSIAR